MTRTRTPRGPGRLMTAKSVVDRCRRLRPDTPRRIEAKRLAREGDTLGTMLELYKDGDVTEAHVQAHHKWLEAQAEMAASVEPEDLA